MSEAKQDGKFWVGRLLLAVLFVFAGWLYYQLEGNYRNLEVVNRSVGDMLEKQSGLTRKYSQELIAAKQKITEAETLVAQLRQENDNLQEKVKLLDKMAELESNIVDLKEKNTALLGEIERLEREALLHPEKIKTLEEGRDMMSKFRVRMKTLDRRMQTIRRDVFVAKIEAQKDLDKKRSLLGNNGFLVRNGMAMPREIVMPVSGDKIKVEVKIVK